MNCLVEPEPTQAELSFFRHIYTKAAELLSQKGQLQPVAFFRVGQKPLLHGPEPRMIVPVQMDMPNNDTGKDALAQALRHLVKQLDADLVLMVLESWMVKPSPAEAEYIQRAGCFHVPPSKHPNRIEIVLFSMSKPNGDSWSGWAEIRRDAQNRPSLPEQPPKLEYLTAGGRFGNLFADDDAIPGGMTNGPASTSYN